jgi:hypothetical protein
MQLLDLALNSSRLEIHPVHIAEYEAKTAELECKVV